jgi:hypothetical protein
MMAANDASSKLYRHPFIKCYLGGLDEITITLNKGTLLLSALPFFLVFFFSDFFFCLRLRFFFGFNE